MTLRIFETYQGKSSSTVIWRGASIHRPSDNLPSMRERWTFMARHLDRFQTRRQRGGASMVYARLGHRSDQLFCSLFDPRIRSMIPRPELPFPLPRVTDHWCRT